jgi:hypothetical protein
MSYDRPETRIFIDLPGKGVSLCNRQACQGCLVVGNRLWNTVTKAYYCPACARRINEAAGYSLCILTENPGA